MIYPIIIVSFLSFIWGLTPFYYPFLPLSMRQDIWKNHRSFSSRYITHFSKIKASFLFFIRLFKGFLPVFLCTFIPVSNPYELFFLQTCCASSVMLGHILSPFIRGIGTSVGMGIILALHPLAFLFSFLLSLFLFILIGYFSFASFLFILSAPLCLLWFSSNQVFLIIALIISVLIVKQQKGALKDWALGQERKFKLFLDKDNIHHG